MSQRTEKSRSCLALDRAVTATRASPASGTIFIKAILPSQFYSGFNQIVALCQNKHLRLEYYSKDRLLVFQAMPSAIHDCVQCWFEHELQRMARQGFIKQGHWLKYISRNYSMGRYTSQTQTQTQTNDMGANK